MVEFAPFQKIPKEHKNPDARQGTIDEGKNIHISNRKKGVY